MAALTIVLLCLATWRTTRLVTRDTLPLVADPVARLQAFVLRHAGKRWAEGLDCPWCVSVWVGGALTLAAALTVGVPLPWLVWPVTSGVAGLLDCVEDRLGRP